MTRYLLSILLLAFGSSMFAQLSFQNTAAYQHGNIPGNEPTNLNVFYDQLNLQYRWKPLRASIRVEQFYSPDSLSGDYQKISQFLLNYRKKGLELKLGNFYETLGQGLLLRGYEIKNAIYEDPIYRVKQGFYKDMLGAYAGYSSKNFAVKLLSGRMLDNQLPITSDERRENYINAGEFRGIYDSYNLGVILLNSTFSNSTKNFLSVFSSGTIGSGLNYYAEFASELVDSLSFFSTTTESRYGAYASVSYSGSGYGLSLEFKDYRNFFIGSGYSDPPTLAKEHTYRLLNRATHIINLLDESGFQAEAFWNPWENHMFTFNFSRNLNEGFRDFVSFEYFLEWYATLDKHNQLKVFIDYSGDDVNFEPERYTAGLYYTRYFNKGWSASFESEWQEVSRKFPNIPANKYNNVYGSIAVNQSTKFSAAFVLEFSNDPTAADLSNTDQIETERFYPGVNLSYRPDRKNTLQLFAGERRGGPACTAGICYEVPDFKGIELIWTLKL